MQLILLHQEHTHSLDNKNAAEDSAWYIIPGYNKVKGKVINSQIAFEDLHKNYLLPAVEGG